MAAKTGTQPPKPLSELERELAEVNRLVDAARGDSEPSRWLELTGRQEQLHREIEHASHPRVVHGGTPHEQGERQVGQHTQQCRHHEPGSTTWPTQPAIRTFERVFQVKNRTLAIIERAQCCVTGGGFMRVLHVEPAPTPEARPSADMSPHQADTFVSPRPSPPQNVRS